jgi:metal-responsive CopG/Arc/MetJ family transcriptional regulator
VGIIINSAPIFQDMSQIISFSVDKSFSEGLENLIEKSGYKNRSKFLRDAALYYADIQQRGEIASMKDDEIVEAHLIIYYQHGIEPKLMEIRHSNKLEITSYSHSCLNHSHTCVDVMHAIGTAAQYRETVEQLQNIPNVDKVSIISAPMRDSGCC